MVLPWFSKRKNREPFVRLPTNLPVIFCGEERRHLGAVPGESKQDLFIFGERCSREHQTTAQPWSLCDR